MEDNQIKNIRSYRNIDHAQETGSRSYAILNLVLEMIERSDSKETIRMVVEYLRNDL